MIVNEVLNCYFCRFFSLFFFSSRKKSSICRVTAVCHTWFYLVFSGLFLHLYTCSSSGYQFPVHCTWWGLSPKGGECFQPRDFGRLQAMEACPSFVSRNKYTLPREVSTKYAKQHPANWRTEWRVKGHLAKGRACSWGSAKNSDQEWPEKTEHRWGEGRCPLFNAGENLFPWLNLVLKSFYYRFSFQLLLMHLSWK